MCFNSKGCTVATFQRNGYRIYVLSYVDNRVAFHVFVVDTFNNVVNSFELKGDRYVNNMVIDCANEKLYIEGQYYQSGYGRVFATFAQLGHGIGCTGVTSTCPGMSQSNLFFLFF